ncbi:MAG: sigma-70 family RNA polymerase sigma factor [Desulfobacteraceae bacterium]|nr:sigma-70 family RNA polymerase sigma factor [Desulfobacteraceae bacterium]
MAKDLTEKAYIKAQIRWPGINADFREYRKRIEASGANPEKMAIEDIYLALALSNASPVALDLFYRQYAGYIHNVSMRVVKKKEFAEDIVQQFVLELPKRILKYRGIGSLYGWLGMVIPNYSRDYLRKIKNYELLDSVPDISAYDSCDEQLDIEYCNELLKEILPKAVDMLKNDWQLMIQCKFFDGLTNREIASAVLKTKEHNVSKWLKKALAKMEKRLINLATEKGPDGKVNLFHCLKLLGKLFDL